MRLTALALFTLLAAGCGGDEPDDEARPTESAPQAASPATSQQPSDDMATGETGAADSQAAGSAPASGDDGAAERPDGVDGRSATEGQGGGPDQGVAAAGAASDEGRLYTVQVAAFTEPASATEWTGRLARQGLPVWSSVAELGGRTFYRVRVGAVPTISEARQLGALITDRYEWPVWLAPLTPADRLPDSAVQRTQQVLRSG